MILVVHSFDVPRATAEFAAVGIEALAAPTGIASSASIQLTDFLPTAAGLQMSYYVLYELFANVLFVVSH